MTKYVEARENQRDMTWRCVRDDGSIDEVHDRSPGEQQDALTALVIWHNDVPPIEEQLRVLSWRGIWGRVWRNPWRA